MKIVYKTVLAILLMSVFVFAYVQNGTYYEIDYGDNYYLQPTATTITIPPYAGGGRVDISGIEREISTIKEMLSSLNKTTNATIDTTSIWKSIEEIQDNLAKIREATDTEIQQMRNTVNEIHNNLNNLISESKGGTLQVLSQAISFDLDPGDYLPTMILVKNNLNSTKIISSKVDGTVADLINIENPTLTLPSGAEGHINLSVYIPPGTPPGLYYGNIIINSGNISLPVVPVTIRVLQSREKILDIKVSPVTEMISPGQTLRVDTTLYNLGGSGKIDLDLIIQLIEPISNNIIIEQTQKASVETSTSVITEINLSKDIPEGRYIIRGIAEFSREGVKVRELATCSITVKRSLFEFAIFGIPIWMILSSLVLIFILFIVYILHKREEARKRRYLETIEMRTLPQPGPRAGFLGRLAETAMRAFFDIDKLTTHVLIAGATGSGKTIAAQVLVEEALQRNVSAIVFDPTAQWTGFLRKNKDKGMFALYGKFGMKEKDARAFNGNIYIVKDPNKKIDIKKYQKPGEITVFCLNKLETPEIETFISNAIRDVFLGGFEETYELKTLIIIDEVHRLLPKFGGSGNGLTQVEHAVREFRKWGLGVILISQVLSDFVGEIKANIGTEIQMRARYEGDLERIKMKYGEDILRSVVKAAVGTGMLQNAEYNKGRPYFISFRPILHSVQRISDKELERYDKFNIKIEELKDKIEKLKEVGVDVFDLELELNLAFDNVKKGSFDVAKLYLESLEPRINSEYESKFKDEAKIEIKKESTISEKPKVTIVKEIPNVTDEKKLVANVDTISPIFSTKVEDKLREKIEGKKISEKVDISSIGLKEITSEESPSRGPEIKKVVSRKNKKVFVYLTVKNNQRTPIKDVYVIDPLPDDATNLDVITHDGFDEKLKDKVAKWYLGTLGMKEKRILHYIIETKLDKLPIAKLQWSEQEDVAHDIKNVLKEVELKKKT
ncbi:MAG: DUF87 domain-containing protein [Candidatus Altiarchaeota archaeon]